MSTWNRKLLVLLGAFAIGVSLSIVGCGKNSGGDVGVIPGGVVGIPGGSISLNCNPGYLNPTGFGCVPGYDFASACLNSNGFLGVNAQMVNLGGTLVCRAQGYGTRSFGSMAGGFSYLSLASAGSGASAIPAIQLLRNDTVTITATGGWGKTSVNHSTILWGLIDVYSSDTDCDQYGLNAGIYNGMLQGFVISDGIKAYPVGSSSIVSIENDGILRLGFNVPYDSRRCGWVNAQISITRCIDPNGNRYSCS